MLFQEIRRTIGRIQFPKGGDCPSRSKDVVIKFLAIMPVIPRGMLYHFRIEATFAHTAKVI